MPISILRWSCWSGGTITTALRLWLSWICALSRVTLPEFLAVNQELILLAATMMPLLLCLMELIVFAAPVHFLLLVGFLELDDATAMLLLLVGLELISAFAAILTLLLLELPLSVVPLNVRRRRQVVSWIRIFLRSFSHACHQLTEHGFMRDGAGEFTSCGVH